MVCNLSEIAGLPFALHLLKCFVYGVLRKMQLNSAAEGDNHACAGIEEIPEERFDQQAR